jgi:hypothetical protein
MGAGGNSLETPRSRAGSRTGRKPLGPPGDELGPTLGDELGASLGQHSGQYSGLGESSVPLGSPEWVRALGPALGQRWSPAGRRSVQHSVQHGPHSEN